MNFQPHIALVSNPNAIDAIANNPEDHSGVIFLGALVLLILALIGRMARD